ncbi:MAG: hypothetical protein H6Q05_1216 [Acidobacteria bacterium]|jgi:hypothetical protein|nr:hypothetical protein [Acidobacteriota bacterium]
MNYPLLVFVAALALTVLSTWFGDSLRRRQGVSKEEGRSDAGLLLGATLTLLFFIIGFSFSMAVNRYDLRKTCEQAEAIAIGTEYSLADLLAPSDAAKVQTLLKKYLDQRMLFYTTRSSSRASEITADTLRLQTELWSTLRPAIAGVPAPLMGVLVSGMNDVTKSQRSSQAAWLNRIPVAAWSLMAIIGIGCCWLIGYRARRTDWVALLLVPLAVSICFFLIADLDSPRGGAIHVAPQNLSSLSQSLPAQ